MTLEFQKSALPTF